MAKRFRLAREKAGLPEDLVLYCGTHDYGTRVLSNTGNLAAVMKTMGHRDVKTAMKYQHPELEIVRAALNQASGPVMAHLLRCNLELWRVTGYLSAEES
jgi:site-specific recombinase XerC